MRNIFKNRTALAIAGLSTTALLLAGCSSGESENAAPTAEAEWGYEGAEGPEHWGELDEAFEQCGVGKAQSPIDLKNAEKKDLVNLEFNYQPETLDLVNNGHSQQITVPAGSTMMADGEEYELQQYHFHTPSEHTVNGKPAAGEIHFVHKNKDGGLAVVGALITEGTSHEKAYAPVIDNLIKEEGKSKTVDGVKVNPADLLPQQSVYTTYDGSLTTPPCSEDVKWFVLDKPVELSAEQIAKLEEFMGENARPVQDLNGREVVEDSTP